MTTYRHRWERADRRCATPSDGDPRDICGCTTPSPDPASKCAHEGCRMLNGYGHILALEPESFVATRCATCGHAIEVKE